MGERRRSSPVFGKRATFLGNCSNRQLNFFRSSIFQAYTKGGKGSHFLFFLSNRQLEIFRFPSNRQPGRPAGGYFRTGGSNAYVYYNYYG